MAELLIVLVVALLAIAVSAVLGPRLGVASPLVLVAIGVAASFLPMFATVTIEPEWVLEGLLPPLLYSSAVSMPSMNFRREFGSISGLSVMLVVASALTLGALFMLVLPDIGFAWGVALGAIISPTDAVATSIVKRTAVSKRVVALLDGESLLNDATALVLLRTAIVATAATFSFWGAVGSFAYAVAVAVIIGVVVGVANLLVRRRVTDATVNTVISFTVPFVASVPTEMLGASGLVAAVVAGLVTGVRAPRDFSPRHRLSDGQNWRTVELVLEGVIFLTMGLQIKSVVTAVEQEHAGVVAAVGVALAAIGVTMLVRTAYVAPLLKLLSAKGRRIAVLQPRIEYLRDRISTDEGRQAAADRMVAHGRNPKPARIDRVVARITRGLADIDYFLRAPLGWRDGVAVVWAGMRGAVTVAAAQTLPNDTPHRSMLILIAFAAATISLVVQGGTLGLVLRTIAPKRDDAAIRAEESSESERLLELMRRAAEDVPHTPVPDDAPRQERFEAAREHRLRVIAAQRDALLDARDDGIFDADVLENALVNLDATQIAIELRGSHG